MIHKSYDPMVDFIDDISTEQDRVIFIKSIALYLVSVVILTINMISPVPRIKGKLMMIYRFKKQILK